MDNGIRICVVCSYTDNYGVEWGLTMYGGNGTWVPMEYLVEAYTETKFEKDNADKIEYCKGTIELKDNKEKIHI